MHGVGSQRLQHSLELIEARSSREAAKAAQTELELRAQIGEASTALETASETEAGLVSTCARVQAEASADGGQSLHLTIGLLFDDPASGGAPRIAVPGIIHFCRCAAHSVRPWLEAIR